MSGSVVGAFVGPGRSSRVPEGASELLPGFEGAG